MNTPPDWTASVHHDSSPRYVSARTPTIGTEVTVRLRAARDAPIEQLLIRTAPDGEQLLTPMRRVATDSACQWWEGSLNLAMPKTSYRFLLLTPEGNWWLNALGLLRFTPTDTNDFKLLANYHAPHWVRDAVFYQIFPDRFADGDPENNVRDGEYLCYGAPVVARGWGEPPHRATGGREFFGGDLQGIIEKLPYLDALGVTSLYLNPIFVAPSNHKYDIADYTQVDPHFGGNEALAALRRALDERAMQLVLDIVPNHCGSAHPWFTEAQRDRNAPTAEFFTFRRHPDEYDSWLGARSLPKLDYRSERLREWMYAGEEAIMRQWLRPPYRIDGWRVDVANMLARQGESQLGHKIGRGIRRAVKAENPHSYLLGENFFDGSPHLQGDELDATMNYRGFSFPLLAWLGCYTETMAHDAAWHTRPALPTEALAAQWQTFLAAIPWQIATQQLNLLGSHDTPRLLTRLGGEEARARLAAALLFTFPGVPSVYYGDEIGLAGGPDPDCRRTMPWEPDAWNESLLALYRTLIQLRRTSPALRWGGYQLLHAQRDTLAFLREAPEERLLVVARRADDGQRALPVHGAGLADGTPLRDLLGSATATVEQGQLPLPPHSGPSVQLWQEIR